MGFLNTLSCGNPQPDNSLIRRVRSSSGRGGGASVVDDVDSVVAGGVFTAGAVVSEGSMKRVFLLTQENNVRSIIKANIIPIDLFI